MQSTFSVVIKHAQQFRNIMNIIQQWTSIVLLQCTTDGITLEALDPCNVSIVKMDLSGNFFGQYTCDHPIAIGLNLEELSKVLSCCDRGESFTLSYTDNADRLRIECTTSFEYFFVVLYFIRIVFL